VETGWQMLPSVEAALPIPFYMYNDKYTAINCTHNARPSLHDANPFPPKLNNAFLFINYDITLS
jgi:hypothetical protein